MHPVREARGWTSALAFAADKVNDCHAPRPGSRAGLLSFRHPSAAQDLPMSIRPRMFSARAVRLRAFLTAIALALGVGAVPSVSAQAAGCDDLSGLPVTPQVDYLTEIQPIWEIRCSNCHVNFSDSPSAQLDLNAEQSWAALYRMPSLIAQGRRMVQPGDPEASFLLEKLRCEQPEAGERMPRGRLPIPLDEQALVRDWIAQGARDQPPLFSDGFEGGPP
jgi:hypothetical protein